MQTLFASQLPLESDDLDLLHRFLEAWCAENNADIHSDEAHDVAAGLIAWYQSGVTDRVQLRNMFKCDHSLPERIDLLMRELDFL